MKIIQKREELHDIINPVLTIGTFDGVHIGHQKIIQQINDLAQSIQGSSTLFTFHPHPRMVLKPDNHGIQLIQTQAEKEKKLRKLGLNTLIIYPFTKEFSQLTATEFVENILVQEIGVKHIVIGYDHQFGKNREGTLDLLFKLAPKHQFNVHEIPAEDINNVNVSSTKIRKALKEGDIVTANLYLGSPFTLSGTVVKGQQIGRSLGFPTANIVLDENHKLIPKFGVYAVVAEVAGATCKGMLNIGVKPTIDKTQKELSIEVHLFDFSATIYDQKIELKLLHYIREEMHFNSLDFLKSQLKKDDTHIRNLLD